MKDTQRNVRKRSGGKPGLAPSFAVAGILCVLLAMCSGLLLMTSQRDIAELARSTRDEVLPVVFEHHRTALNVERLAQLGERVYLDRDPNKRRQARIASRILAQDSIFERDEKAHRAVKRVYESIRTLDRLRDEQDQLRENIEGYQHVLLQVFSDMEAFRVEVAPSDARQGFMLGNLLLDLDKLRLMVGRMHFITDRTHLEKDKALYGLLSREVLGRTGFVRRRLRSEEDKARIAVVEKAVQATRKVFSLQEGVINLGVDAEVIWRESMLDLEELASGMSSNAAVIAADRFTQIHEDALGSMWLSVGGMGVVVLLVSGVAILIRLHVVTPLMAATRGLDLVQAERRAVSLSPNRLREMDAIRRAVERLGVVLQQSARYAGELESANRSLEVEVAERMRAQRELGLAKEVAESAATAKSDFLASMSHEIRTPMNAILGMADMLFETELTTEQRRYVDVFRTSGEMLLDLLNDILDLSKVEAGKVELEAIEFNLNDVVKSACDMVAFKAQEKGLVLRRDVVSGVPTRVVGDPVRLKQVLGNLLGNAVKFTDKGHVGITVRPEPEMGSTGVRIIVEDTGLGIPEEMHGRIFDSFTQADSSTTRKYGGTGLGLTVSRHLVELMGGAMGVESEPDKGTVFSVLLSFQGEATEVAAPASMEKSVPVGMRVLVAEGDEVQRMVIVENLLSLGGRVEDVDHFQDAVEQLCKADEQGDPFNVLLLDAGLEGVPLGLPPAVAVVRELSEPPEVFLVNRAPGTGPAVDSSGAAWMLPRPMGRSVLEQALAAVFEVRPPRMRGVPLPFGSSGRLRVLLVEDIQSNRALVELYLRESNCELTMAVNGQEGLDQFKLSGADVVLMDMQMPVMDGFTATSSIRAWEREKGMDPTPVIALTAHAYKDDVERCMRAGCSSYLAKPVKKADLLETLFRHSFRA